LRATLAAATQLKDVIRTPLGITGTVIGVK
jgi:hypothetical protein